MALTRAASHRELGTQRWKDQRLRVLKRDSYICAYCSGEATQVDHVIPRASGGGHELDNLVACCAPCNSRKGAHNEGVFLARGATLSFQGASLRYSPRRCKTHPLRSGLIRVNDR